MRRSFLIALLLAAQARAQCPESTTSSAPTTTSTTTSSSGSTTTQAPLWPPTGLTGTIVSCSQVDLRWNSASGATNYNIYQWQGSTGTWIVIGNTATLAYSVMGLTGGAKYYFAVASVDSTGRVSMLSEWIMETMPPCAATTTTSSSTTTGVATTSSTSSTTTTTQPPPALAVDVSPVGCVCTDTTVDCSLRLTWSDPNYPNLTVRIDRSTDNATWTTVLSQSSPGQSSFDDHGLAENTTYYYNVTELATGTTAQLMLVPIRGQQI